MRYQARRRAPWSIAVTIVLFLAGLGVAIAQSAGVGKGRAAFDYYLLALSWSPSYCADAQAAARDQRQCQAARPFAFVVHGLWPQYERGYPSECASQIRDVAPALKNAMLDLMPSPGLIEHQWDKHGACTGLSPEAYFAQTRRLRTSITIPNTYQNLSRPLLVTGGEVERAFIAANPSLTPAMIAVVCRDNRLREVRVCFSRDGRPRACGANVRDQCGAGKVQMPPVR
jgi:ribonuclease T2